MTKTDLRESIERITGKSFLTAREIDRFFHRKNGFGRRLMEGIKPWNGGRYFSKDIAERFMEADL